MIMRDYKDRPQPQEEDYVVGTFQALIWGAAALYCVWALRVCVMIAMVQS